MSSIAFSQSSYDEFDAKGKESVKRFFISHGFSCYSDDEERGIDLHFSKEGYSDIYVEVAVRHYFNWSLYEWNECAPWDTIHILKRKAKYGKPEPYWYGDKAYLFELNRSMTQAFVIKPCELQKKYLKMLNNKRGYEWIYDVPVEEFKIFNLRMHR
jgi:hypothetical protein